MWHLMQNYLLNFHFLSANEFTVIFKQFFFLMPWCLFTLLTCPSFCTQNELTASMTLKHTQSQWCYILSLVRTSISVCPGRPLELLNKTRKHKLLATMYSYVYKHGQSHWYYVLSPVGTPISACPGRPLLLASHVLADDWGRPHEVFWTGYN